MSTAASDLFRLTLNDDWSVSLTISLFMVLTAIGIFLLILIPNVLRGRFGPRFEIDSAELGLGSHRLSLRPNRRDQEIAYKIWVELSTRKIGLPIDLKNDVIAEIYDSWHTFFSVTRELIKDIPVNKVRHASTRQIISLSISVLNEGLRPHLTSWQARFRRWYEKKIESSGLDSEPQQVQAEYPRFDDLQVDLLLVNKRLMMYREKMRELVLGAPEHDSRVANPPAKPEL